jgi:hypothetical protein
MKKIIFASAVVMALGLASCTEYLDINQDPNAPSEKDVSTDMILPAVEMNLAVTYGDYLRITGGYYSQIYAHQFGTSNYVDYSQFKMSATRSSGSYTQLYQKVILNAQTIIEKSEAAEDWGTYLAAVTLRAFALQALVDVYGEIPYTEALDPANLTPKYDEGIDIYKGVIAELDNALSKAVGSMPVATSFLFKGEKADKWIEFANSLKFKMLMRMGDVATAQALVDEDNFISDDVKMAGCWKNEAQQESPFYGEEFSTLGGSTQINVVANLAIIGTMQQKDAGGNIVYQDPRLVKYFTTNKSKEYTGNISGTNMSTASEPFNTTDYWCRPVASFDMPVYLLTVSEIDFFLAEYYAIAGDAAKAAANYEAAIKASCATNGLKAADAATILAQYPYDNSKYKECIGIQKWIALAGVNPFEAYCEVRRLDYPAFDTTLKGSDMYAGKGALNVSAYKPGTLYTPYNVDAELGDNKLLERWPYPESSQSRNNKTPKFKGYDTPIFWGE